MVQNHKILTVSYGTFSCTLEGFDDSFGTMKAIAEYFRDLASNDRYFGAEPPVPDAEMLARIAEKEIARRVEARFDDDGLVLRAGASMIQQAPSEPDMPQATTPEGTAGETPAAEDLADDPAAQDVAGAVDGSQSDLAPHAPVSGDVNPVLPEAEVAPAAQLVPDDAATAPAAMTEDLPEEALISQIQMPAAPLTSDSIAAKLARIRAVVAKQDTSRGEYTEDQHAENFLATAAQDISEIIGEDLDVTTDAETEETAPLAENPTDTIVEDSVEEIADAVSDETAAATDTAGERDTEGEDELAMILGKLDAHEARQDLLSDDDGAQDDFDDEDDLRNILADDSAQPDAAETPDEAPAQEADASNESNALPPPPRARVIKVSREEFDRAMEQADKGQGTAPQEDTAPQEETAPQEDTAAQEDTAPQEDTAAQEETAAQEDTAPQENATAQDTPDQDIEDQDTIATGVLDPAEEDALRRELEQIEAEIGSEAETATAAEPETEDRAERVPARTALPDPVAEEQDLSRLLAEAETKMEAPEQSRRRDEFARMRAAVAARQADGDTDTAEKDPESEYRRDLETVVRPRRPDAPAKGRNERPNAPRIPPLKLVAEQRIDSPKRAHAGDHPVRPRRVPAPMQVVAEENATEGRTSFRQFAKSVGARDLTEMLEAAAAYLSIVEGREEFSRPQVMNKIRAIKEDEFSREDGLRSFGQLLREGKIEKTRSGRFTTSESIGYQPEARSAG